VTGGGGTVTWAAPPAGHKRGTVPLPLPQSPGGGVSTDGHYAERPAGCECPARRGGRGGSFDRLLWPPNLPVSEESLHERRGQVSHLGATQRRLPRVGAADGSAAAANVDHPRRAAVMTPPGRDGGQSELPRDEHGAHSERAPQKRRILLHSAPHPSEAGMGDSKTVAPPRSPRWRAHRVCWTTVGLIRK